MFSDFFDDFYYYPSNVPMRRRRTVRDTPSHNHPSLMLTEPNYLDDLHCWTSLLEPRSVRPQRANGHRDGCHRMDQLTNWKKIIEDQQKANEVVLKKAGVSSDDWSFVINQPLTQFRPEDIEISMEDNVLSVSGHRKWQNEDGTQNMSRSFAQSVMVPKDVKPATIQSKVIVGQDSTPQIVIHGEKETKENLEKRKNKVPVEIVFDSDGKNAQNQIQNQEGSPKEDAVKDKTEGASK